MDLFLSIYLTFFFSLLANLFKDNPQLKEMEATRNILNKKKTVNDLDIEFSQVIYFSLIFF